MLCMLSMYFEKKTLNLWQTDGQKEKTTYKGTSSRIGQKRSKMSTFLKLLKYFAHIENISVVGGEATLLQDMLGLSMEKLKFKQGWLNRITQE